MNVERYISTYIQECNTSLFNRSRVSCLYYYLIGIMTEISRGTVRSIVCNANLIVDVVPVDYVIDTLICASWHNAVQRTDTIKIYNCTSSTVHPITWVYVRNVQIAIYRHHNETFKRKMWPFRWGEFENLVRKHARESPSKYMMWYPDFTFRTNKFIHAIIVATLHFLPAFVIDLILRLQGCKPMWVFLFF